MKLPGTCSLSKENEVIGDMLTIKGVMKKKKIIIMGLLFWRGGGGGGGGAPTFWLGLLLFTKRESRTPTFKILVRTLLYIEQL